jgi:RNA polymerase primary sigma factor
MNMFNGNFLQVQRVNRSVRPRLADRKRVGGRIKNGPVKLTTRLARSLRSRPTAQASEQPLVLLDPIPSVAETRPAAAPAEPTSRVRPPSESDSILSLYMREAGEVPLLSTEEEVALAARIQQGDAAAREHMIRANLRFVIKIARDYEHLGMPLLDLINEGNLGLMRAVEKFDPVKGGKLSTYAALWIKQQIRRALASQGKTIRLPVHVADKIYQLGQAEARLRNLLGRDATDEELADELGIKLNKLSRLRRAAMRPASLDAPLGDADSSTVAEVVADEQAATPFEQLMGKTETRAIRHLVAKLPEREARIISCRFGLDDGNERTLEDVGKKFKLTRERIRQLQNLALQKLRAMLEEPARLPQAA